MTDLAPADIDPEACAAVVGVAARFGQAGDLGAFRERLRAPGEAVTDEPLADPYVFDHKFFGISPRESVVLDPQQRILLECAHHALEDAAHDPTRDDAVVGIYAGGATTTHAARLRRQADRSPHTDDRQIRAATGADFLASRVAYKLALTGPAVSVQAAGATALVAVHTAVQALLGGECDLALAGSVTVHAPEGGAVATGGCGVVVLKPLRAALDDGDRIYAVVRGTAVGTAGPGESAEAGRGRTVRDALVVSGVAADTVVAIDTPAGSGVTDTAPAAAAFIRAVLAVHDAEHQSGGAGRPRRAGVSGSGPFGTHAHVILEEAPAPESLIGAPSSAAEVGRQLIPFSAKSPTALAGAAARLGRHLEQAKGAEELQDAAWTLQTGRTAYAHRGFVVAQDHAEAAAALAEVKIKAKDRAGAGSVGVAPPVVFTFPGHGGQHVGMGRGLYRLDPYFRADLDRCAEHVRAAAGVDLRVIFDPRGEEAEETARQFLADGAIVQLALFVLEYALARAFIRWGIRPSAVVGHSLGGYAAACVAGVFSFPDAIRMVIKRTELLLGLADGAMAAVRLGEAELLPLLPEGVGIAAISGPDQVTISGPREPVTRFVEEQAAKGLETRLLKIPGAGHSSLVDPVLDEYEAFLTGIVFHEPAIRIVSDTTGTWADPAEISTPAYWCRHMRNAVRYHDVLETLQAVEGSALVEVGPGTTLTSLARRHGELRWSHPILQGLPHPTDPTPDTQILLSTIGSLWAAGVEVEWPALHPLRDPRKTSLPGYPFERSAFPVPGA
ncbi:type I polyketide synthase [Streptomyces sp. SID13666]|uniref:acyltransferase domain-containing protein n=1 Tax=unclassified Streptomyces TaxID=2593676 RepID=UPI0013C1C278|nr:MULTISPECIES: type I polyketide synthase [unclassified Streptomyces]NEA55085.1 type I polyketide synthase [Streptomyces sp. SID13666]NEA71092.1 type I polyketide synthase [Streptomyces sp. SID13588]